MVYILLAPGFEEAEALVPADLLRRAGVEAALAALEGELVPGGHGITVKADLALDQVDLDRAEMIVLPGGGVGVKNYMVTDKTGPVVGIKVVDGSEDLLLVTQAGILIRTHVDSIRMAGRATQGVIVMRFKEEGDKVISLALADREENAETEEVQPEEAPPESETPAEE